MRGARDLLIWIERFQVEWQGGVTSGVCEDGGSRKSRHLQGKIKINYLIKTMFFDFVEFFLFNIICSLVYGNIYQIS